MTVQLSLAEKRLLLALPPGGEPCNVADLVGDAFASEVEALRAAGGPERHGLVAMDEEEILLHSPTPEGLSFKEIGFPERRAAAAIAAAGGALPMGQLATAAGLSKPEVGIAVGWLKRRGWATLERGQLSLAAGEPAQADDEALLATLSDEPAALAGKPGFDLLAGRVLAEHEQNHRFLRLSPEGQSFVAGLDPADAAGEEVSQVTPELIAHWADMSPEERSRVHLRPFDFDVPVAPRYPGKEHPLTQIMHRIRAIFWRMGFEEIAGDYVESAFWNMDALFIPQDHPAREMQDTFYLDHPAALPVDDDDLARGRAVHEHGGDTGSSGWGSGFSDDVSRKGLLRTHTTNTTIRYLAKHYQGVESPQDAHKVFGLGKVFRKETMDATHLPEFYQIEGIVTEPDANFNMLVGMCREFFTRMGFPQVRFRPAYFPYTEPSMEIEVFYNNRWMELGGCGVFRPEVTEPLDVRHPVLAWGFGLERLAMMSLGLKDIRDLYVSDVQWLRETPLQ